MKDFIPSAHAGEETGVLADRGAIKRKNAFSVSTVNRLNKAGLIDPDFSDSIKVLFMQQAFGVWAQNSYDACWSICCHHTALLTEEEREEFQAVAFIERAEA